MVVVTNKQLFFLIPLAVYHFLFQFSFPQMFGSFLFRSVCSVSHIVLVPECETLCPTELLVPFARTFREIEGVSTEQQHGETEC